MDKSVSFRVMKNLITILCLCLFWFSCEEDNSENSLEYIYPMTLGNTWVYEMNLTYEIISGDDCGMMDNYFQSDTIIIDSIYSEIDNIYRFKDIMLSTRPTIGGYENDTLLNIGYSYFSNSDNGLHYHGNTDNSSSVAPWSEHFEGVFKINEQLFTETQLIELFFNRNDCWEDPPRLSIKYPIVENEQWIWRELTNSCGNDIEPIPFRMDKIVKEINGNTFTIQVLYDLNEDSEWDENIKVYKTYSENGLIEINIEVEVLTPITIECDQETIYNMIYNYNLVDYQIN